MTAAVLAMSAAAAVLPSPAGAAPVRPAGSPVSPARTRNVTPAKAVVPRERRPQQAAPPRWPSASSTDLALAGATRAVSSPVSVGAATGPARQSASAGPDLVRVDLLGHDAAVRAGVSGFLFSLSRRDAAPSSGEVRATLDYSAFAGAYSGDFAYRLAVVAYPACLATTPQVAACRSGTPVRADNDVAHQKISADLVAEPAARPAATVYALTSAPSAGAVGDYTADSLKPSDTWNTGTQSGGFSYSYPIAAPPAPGGLLPKIDLAYSSQSVDGRTSAVNGQASDVGMGWERSQPFIERQYRSCGDQWTFSGGASGIADSGDACWDSNKIADNATLSLDGVASPLVQNAQNTGQWTLKNDNGWTVQQLSGAVNDDKDGGEYWVITTTEGVKYFFGSGRTPASANPTSSVQTRPVFGKDSCTGGPVGTGGHHYCYKAYRWNLDYVVDPHGNSQSWYYNRDGNTSYQSVAANTKVGFTRDAYVADIYYGANPNGDGTWNQSGWMHFDYAYRCNNGTPTVPGTCTAPNSGSSFPDVPSDLICSTQTVCPTNAPVFYHTKLLTAITTRAADSTAGVTQAVAGWRDVDRYDLSYSYLATDDTATAASLWLRNITRTGYGNDGTTGSAPPQTTWLYSTWTQDAGANYVATPLPNRIDNNGNHGTRPPVNMYRLGEIVTPLGGLVRIGYYQPDPCTGPGPADVMSANSNLNNYDCFPQYLGAGDGQGTTTGGAGYGTSGTPWGWFNKYLVKYTVVQDNTAGYLDTATVGGTVLYNGYTGYAYQAAASEGDPNTGAAWRFTSNAIAPTGPAVAQRSWTDYRGYRNVTVTHAAAVCDELTCSAGTVDSRDAYVFMRGMDADCTDKQCTATRSVSVRSSFANDTRLPTGDPASSTLGSNDVIADRWEFNGRLRAHQHFDPSGNQMSGQVDWHSFAVDPGRTQLTNGYSSQSALVVPVYDVVWHANGRYGYTSYTHDNLGKVRTTSERRSDNTAYRCQTQYYARSGSAGPGDPTWELPSRAEHWSGDCASGTQDGWTVDSYDGYSGDGLTEPLTKGDLTATAQFTDAGHALTTSRVYDGYGRVTSMTDPTGSTTSTSYGRLYHNPLTVTTTNALGQVSSVDLDPGRGLTERSTDVNGNATALGYDSLGRLTGVWQPGDAPAGGLWNPSGGTPTDTFAYQSVTWSPITRTTGGTNMVTTSHRKPSGSGYTSRYAYVDGLGRTFQTATAAPDGTSSIYTATMFDPQGRVMRQIEPFQVANSAPSSGPRMLSGLTGIRETDTVYDAAGRPVSVSRLYQGAVVTRSGVSMTTSTAYLDDRKVVTGPSPTGSGTAATTTWLDEFGRETQVDQPGPAGVLSTRYQYDDHDYLRQITDAAGHDTVYGLDLLGRRLTGSDPDAGQTSSVYDGNGQVISATDALGQTTLTGYDALGRKTAVVNTGGFPYTTGKTGFWKLADGTGTTAADSGGTHPLALAGGAAWSTDRGGAAVFDGTSGAATATTAVVDTTASFSVSLWVKPQALGGVAAAQRAGTNTGFTIWADAADHLWHFRVGAGDSSPAPLADYAVSRIPATVGAWTHLTATFDAASHKLALYVNGTLSGTGTHNTAAADSGTFTLGAVRSQGVTTSFLHGSLSDVQVYPRALNTQETATVAGVVNATTYDSTTITNGKGRLATQTTYSGADAYTTAVTGYDSRGRSLGTSWTIPSAEPGFGGRTYTASVAYDAAGNATSLTYPGNDGLPAETATTTYDQYGDAVSLVGSQTYATGSFDVLNRLKGRTLGTGVVRTYGYEADTGALQGLAAASGGTTIQNDVYARNAASQVVSLTDTVNGQAQCYRYDSLARLTQAFTTTTASGCATPDHTFTPVPGETAYDTTYAYSAPVRTVSGTTVPAVTDGMNALAAVTDNITGTTTAYGYTDAAHEHAPTIVGAGTYTYDANGNQTGRTTAGTATTLTWNRLQQLESLTSGTSTTGNIYGADGTRLIRHDPSGDAVLFIGGEELVYTRAAGTVSANRYYALAGTTVAQRSASGVTYLLGDAQGTASLAVTSTGTVTRQYYTPFGNQRGGQALRPITDRGFLGHVQDYDVGLVENGARFYDPAAGVFISPDPVNTAGAGQLNAYAYAADNPVTYSDPSGLHVPPPESSYTTPPQCDWVCQALKAANAVADTVADGYHDPYRRSHLRPVDAMAPFKVAPAPSCGRNSLRSFFLGDGPCLTAGPWRSMTDYDDESILSTYWNGPGQYDFAAANETIDTIGSEQVKQYGETIEVAGIGANGTYSESHYQEHSVGSVMTVSLQGVPVSPPKGMELKVVVVPTYAVRQVRYEFNGHAVTSQQKVLIGVTPAFRDLNGGLYGWDGNNNLVPFIDLHPHGVSW
ncbi:LamG-like jellyroll fold domain-containing protein [Catellatospora sp. TT07R-123]|uniref:LamG-like jellyroll fold domain-containing protein n=1 Tax=Catellatospora sp. TT07R-123 TaxID=2733863 RepID=UPI001BB44C1A|nr:LamG-like jellyroll fold domain-containing protein [Catellatospora sp. TT07R-123]